MTDLPNQETRSVGASETSTVEALAEFYQHYRKAMELARLTDEPSDFEELARFRGAIVDLQRTREALGLRQSGAMSDLARLMNTQWAKIGAQGMPESYSTQLEEDIKIQAVIEECLRDIVRVREQMRNDQTVIDELKAETKMLIAELKAAA
jgi:hypothetical protein